MKPIDISTLAIREDKYQFRMIVDNCDYYAIALPYSNVESMSYLLLGNAIRTNIRIVRADELKHFAETSRMIIQNGNEFFMNFDGSSD